MRDPSNGNPECWFSAYSARDVKRGVIRQDDCLGRAASAYTRISRAKSSTPVTASSMTEKEVVHG